MPGNAFAQRVRRRFDPDDLALETPGVLHADVAFGIVRGEAAGRWLAPDFDLDLGLSPNVEIGIDGAVAIEGSDDRPLSLDHLTQDNLWLSSKIGLWDARDADAPRAWAAGFQLGPRIAASPEARGTGFQVLGLVARTIGRSQTVLNLGGLVEPGSSVSSGRPTAALVGIDFKLDLDQDGVFSMVLDASLVAFLSSDKSQLTSTGGFVFRASPWLDLSATALVGALAGGDRYGAYIGMSPKLPLL